MPLCYLQRLANTGVARGRCSTATLTRSQISLDLDEVHVVQTFNSCTLDTLVLRRLWLLHVCITCASWRPGEIWLMSPCCGACDARIRYKRLAPHACHTRSQH